MHIHYETTKVVYDTTITTYIKELNPRSVCITTDPIMLKLGIVKPLETFFTEQGIPYELFSDVAPNPSSALVEKGLLHIVDHKPDVVIAVGGGSAIDLAKAIIYYCIQLKSKLMHTTDIHKPLFIAVPTTSGTGSEVTNYAVITDEVSGTKEVIQSAHIQPDVALLDPSLTYTVPAHITAETGFDALTHGIEALVATGRTSFSDAYAKESIQTIYKSLLPSYTNGEDKQAKAALQLAATMAGMAFNIAGLGLCHSIAHSLGSHFHIAHGKANALVLPSVVAFNAQSTDVTKQYSELAKGLGFTLASDKDNVDAFIQSLYLLKHQLQLPRYLTDINITKETITASMDMLIADIQNDFCLAGNPVSATREDIKGILMTLVP